MVKEGNLKVEGKFEDVLKASFKGDPKKKAKKKAKKKQSNKKRD